MLLFAVPPPEADPPPEDGMHALSSRVDEVTGQHGYSHLGIQCCDDSGDAWLIDASHLRKKISATRVSDLGKNSHQTLYGRIPIRALAHLEIDCEHFCRLAHELLATGLPHSVERLRDLLRDDPLLMRLLEDPPRAGLLCTDVLAYCVAPGIVRRIVRHADQTLPGTLASGMGMDKEVFFTPNALALALGLPHARTLRAPGQELSPTMLCMDVEAT